MQVPQESLLGRASSEHSYLYLEVQPEIELGSFQTCLCMHSISALITAVLDRLVHRSVGTTMFVKWVTVNK